MEGNFKKQGNDVTDLRGSTYDFTSVMQYGNTAFSKDGTSKTMEAVSDKNKVFGNAKQLSASDKAELNKVYDCASKLVQISGMFDLK